MPIQTVAVIISCTLAVGGVLIFIGRSLGTLQSIGEAVSVALAKTDRHELELTTIKIALAKVETRQEDCEKCP